MIFITITCYTTINSNITKYYFIRIYKLGNIFNFNFPIYYLNGQHIYNIPYMNILVRPCLLQ